jgi:hypothetical protein
VSLNVYDIVPYNDVLVPWGLGVHHTAIEVHGMEIAFGRCQRGSGVFECQPKRCPGHKFREQLVLGTTPYSQVEVEQWLLHMMHAVTDTGNDGPVLREAVAVNEQEDDDEGGNEGQGGRYSPVEGKAASIYRSSGAATPPPRPPTASSAVGVHAAPAVPDDASYWLGQRYHLLRNNCNHFSAYVAATLLPPLPTPPFGQDEAFPSNSGIELAVGSRTSSTRWCRGVPSDVTRYETGHMELVACRLSATGGAPPLVAPQGTPRTELAVIKQVLLPALVPTWANRLSVLGCSLLPTSWVDQLETLDRQAQSM